MQTILKTDRLLKRLAGGDRRSIGDADKVAKVARGDATAIAELVRGLRVKDPVVRMRAADSLEKVTREDAGLLAPHKSFILRVLDSSDQSEVRWQLVQCLPRLPFTHKELSKLMNIGKNLTERLAGIGILNRGDLVGVGAVNAYLQMQAKSPVNLPVCYNLYALEGALRGCHWDALPEAIKDDLYRQAKGTRRVRSRKH